MIDMDGGAAINWEAIGAVAELAGAAGVIASLLYIAAQVHTSNRASAVQAKLYSTQLLNDFMDLLIQRPELNQLMLKGRKAIDTLSPDEYQQFSNMSLKAFWFFSAGHFQYRRGTIADNDWFEILAVLRYWLYAPGCRAWWERVGSLMFGTEFVAFVESELGKVVAQQGAAAGASSVVAAEASKSGALANVDGGPRPL
jgi:hypothetical protein